MKIYRFLFCFLLSVRICILIRYSWRALCCCSSGHASVRVIGSQMQIRPYRVSSYGCTACQVIFFSEHSTDRLYNSTGSFAFCFMLFVLNTCLNNFCTNYWPDYFLYQVLALFIFFTKYWAKYFFYRVLP